MRARLLLPAVLTFLVLGTYIYSHVFLFRIDNWTTQRIAPRTWNMPSTVLQVVAGEFKGLVADMLVLEIGAQLGTHVARKPGGGWEVLKQARDWPTIMRLFNHSRTLDPHFQQTYMLAQGWLPWDAQMIDDTQDLLRTAAESRPWDWQPLHFMGFNAYYFLDRPGEAGKIFFQAAKTPNAPSFLAILGGRLALKGGETEAAILLMESVIANKTEDDEGYHDMVKRLQALRGVRVIELGFIEFRKIFKRNPVTVGELIQNELLEGYVDNPYGDDYCIDVSGKVYFDDLNCQQPE